jgi:hypothetical protein
VIGSPADDHRRLGGPAGHAAPPVRKGRDKFFHFEMLEFKECKNLRGATGRRQSEHRAPRRRARRLDHVL